MVSTGLGFTGGEGRKEEVETVPCSLHRSSPVYLTDTKEVWEDNMNWLLLYTA